jgi:hypothetical protein
MREKLPGTSNCNGKRKKIGGNMKKEILAKLSTDAENDLITLNEIIAAEKGIEAIAERFSSKLSTRHGAEFGGVLSLKYNKNTGKVELYCGQQKTPAMTFAPEDLSLIPQQVMLLRKRKMKEAEMEDWNKSRNVKVE